MISVHGVPLQACVQGISGAVACLFGPSATVMVADSTPVLQALICLLQDEDDTIRAIAASTTSDILHFEQGGWSTSIRPFWCVQSSLAVGYCYWKLQCTVRDARNIYAMSTSSHACGSEYVLCTNSTHKPNTCLAKGSIYGGLPNSYTMAIVCLGSVVTAQLEHLYLCGQMPYVTAWTKLVDMLDCGDSKRTVGAQEETSDLFVKEDANIFVEPIVNGQFALLALLRFVNQRDDVIDAAYDASNTACEWLSAEHVCKQVAKAANALASTCCQNVSALLRNARDGMDLSADLNGSSATP